MNDDAIAAPAATAETVTIVLPDNGQQFALPAELAQDDDFIRKFLAPHYPDVSSAQLHRQTKNGVTTIKIIKRAGRKGSFVAPLRALLDAPVHVNPAVALSLELLGREDEIGPEALLELQPAIDAAIASGEVEIAAISAALRGLARAAPVRSSASVPVGF